MSSTPRVESPSLSMTRTHVDSSESFTRAVSTGPSTKRIESKGTLPLDETLSKPSESQSEPAAAANLNDLGDQQRSLVEPKNVLEPPPSQPLPPTVSTVSSKPYSTFPKRVKWLIVILSATAAIFSPISYVQSSTRLEISHPSI